MSRNLSDLKPEFLQKIKFLIANCELRGIKMIPYLTYRSPKEQAKLWRQGRSTTTIKAKIKELKAQHCDYIADLIESVGPQAGTGKVTNALPGQSFHQFGEAVDFYWEKEKGTACWNHNELNQDGLNGYKVLHEEAHKLNLYTVTLDNGGNVDWPHIQFSPSGKPPYSLKELNDLIKEMK